MTSSIPVWASIVLTPLLPDIWAHWNYTRSMWPHYVALFRGHLNFSTVSLLSQTTFRYSMSNKSPEQLSPLFVQKLTNVTRPFYISPDSAELANSLCLCIISYSLSLHNQILFLCLHSLFPTAPELQTSEAYDELAWPARTHVVSIWLLQLQQPCNVLPKTFGIFFFFFPTWNESVKPHCFLHGSLAACSIKQWEERTLTVQNLIVHFNPPLLKWLRRTGGARVIICYLGT